jgi:hypothetical protein
VFEGPSEWFLGPEHCSSFNSALYIYRIGSSDFDNVVLDWQNIYKIVLEKAFFIILWRFYLFLVLVLKNLKNGPSER